MGKKKCFVVMGFGRKVDAATGRTLDLDSTYQNIIKRAVEAADLECIRADEVIHAGIIDKPMYELLFEADVVVADLSTSNANAIYELGVRHALRPNTTVVIAESEFKFPFDIGHLVVRTYKHLGEDIGFKEAQRMCGELETALRKLVDEPAVDSPVYTFLHDLRQPARFVAQAMLGAAAADGAAPVSPADAQSAAVLREMFLEARAEADWGTALKCLNKLLVRMPRDTDLLQQKAFATYMAKQPDKRTALLAARTLLQDELNPGTTTDPETLGLWGAVHKRLYEIDRDPALLEASIRAYAKGYIVKDDHYTGINYAYVLNMRAAVSPPREALADAVLAERVRRRVAPLCRSVLDSGGVKKKDGSADPHGTFWVQASLMEALVGIGDEAGAAALEPVVRANPPEPWMPATMDQQITNLRGLLASTQDLVVSKA